MGSGDQGFGFKWGEMEDKTRKAVRGHAKRMTEVRFLEAKSEAGTQVHVSYYGCAVRSKGARAVDLGKRGCSA